MGSRKPATTPAAAVAIYFMPLVNLFMPYAVMAEIWRYSDPSQAAAAQRSTSRLVGWWWFVFLASRVALIVLELSILEGPFHPSIDQMESDTLWSIGGTVGELISAALAILLIWKIDKNQSATHLLAGSPADAAIA